jgi:hypothetical protein
MFALKLAAAAVVLLVTKFDLIVFSIRKSERKRDR